MDVTIATMEWVAWYNRKDTFLLREHSPARV